MVGLTPSILACLLFQTHQVRLGMEDDELDELIQTPEQFTPDKADWSSLNSKASQNTDHSPDGVDWIAPETWQEWDGTIYNPSEHSKKEFAALICQGDTVRGIRKLFNDNKPFADNQNPTKAEVDNWHAMALNHVRAMVGYTGDEYTIKPDKCLHIRALWSDERHRSRMWDTAEYPGTCAGSTNPHCGASFLPSVQDQQEYLPAGIASCGGGAGSEGIFNAAKSNIPWSIRWVRPFCQTLGAEGFWGGHTHPWFHRTEFGWNWWDADHENPNSNAILRAKWSGPRGATLYENPGLGDLLVDGADPRFPGYECEGIQWGQPEESASLCYKRMLADDGCGKRFMTYNSANNGCACYPPDMATCSPRQRAGRLTWDFEPVASSFDGYMLPDQMLYNGRRCQNIIWKTTAGDASHCLQKVIEENYPECGRKYITWNANGGGCACYPPEQTTCQSRRESGRQTYELLVDPARDAGI